MVLILTIILGDSTFIYILNTTQTVDYGEVRQSLLDMSIHLC